MRRRVRHILGAAVLGALIAAASVALAADAGTYTHIWRAQSMLGGDLGGTVRQEIEVDEITLEAGDAGTWTGAVDYADRLGVRDAGGTTRAQVSSIELVLDGADIEAGATLGGTFTGDASVAIHEVARPGDAFSDDTLGALVSDTTYEVAGHWGASWQGDLIVGEIIYETAAPVGAEQEDMRAEAVQFNRLSGENPDGLGDAQTFLIDTGSPPPGDGGTDSGSGGESGSGGDGEEGAADAPSFWDYVRRGAGGDETDTMPAPDELAAAARRMLDAEPDGATPMPDDSVALWIHLAGTYVDAKNRAADLLDDDGPTPEDPGRDEVWKTAREATVRPVAPGDVDLADYYGRRLLDDIEGLDVGGADTLRDDVLLVLDGPRAADAAPSLKVWSDVVAAVAPGPSGGDTATDAYAESTRVLDEPVPTTGPEAEAVLVWARHETAPFEAFNMEEFDDEPSSDASISVEVGGIVASVLARHGTVDDPPALTWSTTSGTRSTAPQVWPAFSDPTGRLLWRADGDGPVALTDGSLSGWAFEIGRAWLVDASHIGRVRAVYAVE